MKYPCTREYYGGVLTEGTSSPPIIIDTEDDDITEYDIPAWSLHRLIEMIGDMFEMQHWLGFNIEKDYDHTIDCIQWLIEDNRFSKEYLV